MPAMQAMESSEHKHSNISPPIFTVKKLIFGKEVVLVLLY